MCNWLVVLSISFAVLGLPVRGFAASPERDYTCFQIAAPYSPEVDLGSDVVMVYGLDAGFGERAAHWREHGYTVSAMTGIAWGNYSAYFGRGEAFKAGEVQTKQDGSLYMHGPEVGYNVPTPGYTAFMKRLVERAVDAGVKAIHLEEPEYWVKAGWSPAFKDHWATHYGEPWQAPDSGPAAQYRASALKYKLYYDMLREVCAHIDAYAKDKGVSVECIVPTHSLINYAHWQIVSPESRLLAIPEIDGVIAQVWTGTARTPINYRGVLKERTFDAAFFEYGQMCAMVRGADRKLWFLADPVEDNPNRTWNDYKQNYERTLVASLMWPEVHRFEVMPWPERVFRGQYVDVEMDAQTGARQGIASDYAAELLAVANALNEMAQSDVRYDTGARGIGIVVSDTLMFQRLGPGHSDWGMGHFYGPALPLLKAGIPLEPVQLEHIGRPNALERYKLLLLSYDGQKPPAPVFHDRIADWVRAGGCLLYIGNGADPFHHAPGWWNADGKNAAKAYDHLFAMLGIGERASDAPQPVGDGYVRVLATRPAELSMRPDGPEYVQSAVKELFECAGRVFETQNYLCVRRGPYVVAAVLEETASKAPLTLDGAFIDLFQPTLPVIERKALAAGECGFLYDLEWAREHRPDGKVLAAAARIKRERWVDGAFNFVARGPQATNARAQILLPRAPKRITTVPSVEVGQEWNAEYGLLELTFPNVAQDIAFTIHQ